MALPGDFKRNLQLVIVRWWDVKYLCPQINLLEISYWKKCTLWAHCVVKWYTGVHTERSCKFSITVMYCLPCFALAYPLTMHSCWVPFIELPQVSIGTCKRIYSVFQTPYLIKMPLVDFRKKNSSFHSSCTYDPTIHTLHYHCALQFLLFKCGEWEIHIGVVTVIHWVWFSNSKSQTLPWITHRCLLTVHGHVRIFLVPPRGGGIYISSYFLSLIL